MPAHPYTSEQLQEALDLVERYGSISAAARSIGMPRPTLQSRYHAARLRQRLKAAQDTGNSATNPIYPAGDQFFVKGTSTLIGPEGETRMQWIKTSVDEDRFKAMVEAACRAAVGDIEPLPRVCKPEFTDSDLCTLYTLTDSHVGMLAWGREAGEDWDLEIAERCLTDTLTSMILAAPAAQTGIINQLGDFLHFDSLRPETPEHRHILDADSRYQKVVEVAVRILRRIVDFALQKHERIQIYMHEGNHDPAGSVWLRVLFAHLYAGNPRVSVDQSPLPYVAYQHGKTMLCFHHGHLSKNASLPLLFAARFHEIWGATKRRYIHVGHRHHIEEKEHPGVVVVQHPTLAAADAYAARGGWLSERQATAITYSKERGEVSRAVFVPQ